MSWAESERLSTRSSRCYHFYLIAFPHILVQATSERFLPTGATFRVGSASESHWLHLVQYSPFTSGPHLYVWVVHKSIGQSVKLCAIKLLQKRNGSIFNPPPWTVSSTDEVGTTNRCCGCTPQVLVGNVLPKEKIF